MSDQAGAEEFKESGPLAALSGALVRQRSVNVGLRRACHSPLLFAPRWKTRVLGSVRDTVCRSNRGEHGPRRGHRRRFASRGGTGSLCPQL